MSELPLNSEKLNFVKEQIQKKAWYGLDPQTGAFNWQDSVNNLASAFSLTPEQVNKAVSDAYTPDCLTKVKDGVPLLQAVIDLSLTPYIWTVGDPDWQKTKFERSGADKFIDPKHYYCSPYNKIEPLKRIVKKILKNKPQNPHRIIVVDDKPENLDLAMQLSDQFKDPNLHMGNYHMKLSDPQADTEAFYEWLKKELEQSDENISLILDFDGVVADTNAVLFGPASVNIARLIV